MKTRLPILMFVLICVFFTPKSGGAQDEVKETKFQNEIDLGISNATYRLDWLRPIQLLGGYRRTLNHNWKLRAQYGFSYFKSDRINDIRKLLNHISNIGIERKIFELHEKRFRFFFASDIIYLNRTSIHYNNSNERSSSTHYHLLGLSYGLGMEYWIIPRLGISYDFMFRTGKQKVKRSSNGFPDTIEEWGEFGTGVYRSALTIKYRF